MKSLNFGSRKIKCEGEKSGGYFGSCGFAWLQSFYKALDSAPSCYLEEAPSVFFWPEVQSRKHPLLLLWLQIQLHRIHLLWWEFLGCSHMSGAKKQWKWSKARPLMHRRSSLSNKMRLFFMLTESNLDACTTSASGWCSTKCGFWECFPVATITAATCMASKWEKDKTIAAAM